MKYLLLFTAIFANFIMSAQLSIEHFEPPTELESKLEYVFKVKYTSDRNINIFFEFKEAPDQGFGFKNVRVGPATDKVIDVVVKSNRLPPESDKFFIRAYFFENQKIVPNTLTDVKNIRMFINVTEDMVELVQPPLQLFAQNQYDIDLKYQATQERDLVLELHDTSGKIGEGRKTVPGGANTETIRLNLEAIPGVGEGYFYKGYIVPVGEDISQATNAIPVFTGISVVDFLGEPCDEEVVEKDGLVIIEAEDIDIAGTGWQRKTEKSGYTGISYLEWLGRDAFNTPGNGVISAKIRITKTGKYRFIWRNRVGFGGSTTEHNDSWLRFPDVPASNFFGEKSNGSRTYPRGSGLSPNPEGSSGSGWFKIYVNSLDWNLGTTTGDNADGRPVFVQFDAPGVYTLEISGRSKNHLIDRIILSNGGANATEVATPKSICSSVLGIADLRLKDFGINVSPNPVRSRLLIQGLEEGDVSKIYDIHGRVVIRESISKGLGDDLISVELLTAGVYFFAVENKGVQKIIVQ